MWHECNTNIGVMRIYYVKHGMSLNWQGYLWSASWTCLNWEQNFPSYSFWEC